MKIKPFFRFDPIATILLTAVVFLASQFIAAVLLGFYPAIKNFTDAETSAWLSDSTHGRFIFILLIEFFTIALVLRLLRAAKVRKERIGLVRPRLSDAGWAFVAYGLYFLAFIAVTIVVRATLTGVDFEQEQQIGFSHARAGGELFLVWLSLAVLPPIGEEVLFRGFLFSGLRAKFRFRYATIITSILFGIAHLQFGSDAPLLWAAAIDTFILSCFLCYLRERSGSLWPPIFLHAIKNTMAYLILFGPRFF